MIMVSVLMVLFGKVGLLAFWSHGRQTKCTATKYRLPSFSLLEAPRCWMLYFLTNFGVKFVHLRIVWLGDGVDFHFYFFFVSEPRRSKNLFFIYSSAKKFTFLQGAGRLCSSLLWACLVQDRTTAPRRNDVRPDGRLCFTFQGQGFISL